MNKFVPCPKCGGNDAEIMSFTWWGGIIGPKILTHVECKDCGETFNGKTGGDNKTNIIIYCVVVGLILAGIFLVLTAIGFIAVFSDQLF